ncbi:helix-turn-helix domain-containing protein [Granulicella aggregans]|jgi:transcriptional regulator with XRE-family HTH domain|uniref:helix-turn-helix domain-containing protein n=1 Tax=Granulicella aggregans TaxID=474949 RepID=UPI0021E06845|nr:helix-turn-helix transcriptional regulator [Granulicella aggregans]
MEGIGGKLRAARLAWKLTLREVEQRTLRLAQQWGNPAYRISASWLDRVERENRGLSATKLIVLANIYSLTPDQMLGMCPTPDAAFTPSEDLSVPNATLLAEGNLDAYAKVWLPDTLVTEAPAEATALLPAEQGLLPSHYRRAVIGRQDRTLEPMIRAGSIVLIDTQKRSIATRREWNHEFDRPIYFLMTREGYVSGFCELDKESDWLTVIPHALSFESNRRWRYRKDIEVVGTVVAAVIRRTN